MKPKRAAGLAVVSLLFLSLTIAHDAFGQAVIQDLVQNSDMLRYENFRVPIDSHRIRRINWTSVPLASRHDKKISQVIGKTANFAGHYRIVQWDCGPGHKCWVIIDVKTGWIYEQYPTTCGVDFKPSSRMLVGSDCMPGVIHAGGNIGVFEWRDNRLIQIQLGSR